MKNKLVKALAVGMLVVSTATVNAAVLTGDISFAVDFSVNQGTGLADAAILAPVLSGPSWFVATGATGDYIGNTGQPIGWSGNYTTPLLFNLTVTPVNQNFPLWEFVGTSGYYYRLISTGFNVVQGVSGGSQFVTVTGTGVAYVMDSTKTFNILDPSLADWQIVGTQTGASMYFAMSSSATGRTPDGGTTLVLLGLALSGLGLIRNKLS